LFKSLGIALEDIAFADLIVRRALERGVGKPMP
jgi:ornithine cyclodeaminase/alanine dehydrogenase-like protein (mu-crystallin family)